MFALGIIDILLIIVSIILIILVAMQNSKDDIGNALTGTNSELFKNQKERGIEVYIVRATYVFSVAFIALAILLLLGIG